MSELAREFDPRLLVLPIEAHYIPTPNADPVNGILILSKIGLHFYGQRFISYRRTFVDIPPEHIPLKYVEVTNRALSSTPIIKATSHLPLGQVQRIFTVGYTKAIGRGDFGKLFAGIGNSSKHLSTGDSRSGFVDAVEQMRRQAPHLHIPSDMNPHVAHLRYFSEASALGPAIACANKALRYAAAQAEIAARPGFFAAGKLKEEGYNRRDEPFAFQSSQMVTSVKRQRAWLMVDAEYFTQMIDDDKKQFDSDAEVALSYGLMHLILSPRQEMFSYIRHARKLEPNNPSIVAALAWACACMNQDQEAKAELSRLQGMNMNNRHALLFRGCAREALGERNAALNDYFASAAMARGYFEGGYACKRAIRIAAYMGKTTALKVAQKLTELLPEQREAWQGLVAAAKDCGQNGLVREAQEHVTLMQGTLL